jgi:hypothetical protein
MFLFFFILFNKKIDLLYSGYDLRNISTNNNIDSIINNIYKKDILLQLLDDSKSDDYKLKNIKYLHKKIKPLDISIGLLEDW